MSVRPVRRDEDGSALLLALGVTAVALSLGLTVATTSVVAIQSSGADRQRASLTAAAESGIDFAHAQLAASTTSWPCTSPQALPVGNGSDLSTVTVTLQYRTSGGSATTCTGSPASVEVTSTAVAIRSLQGGAAPHATMRAGFTLTTSTSGPTTLTMAVLGDGGVTADNYVEVLESSPGAMDATVYSDSGPLTCSSSGQFQGSLISRSDVILRNTCSSAGPVWAGGRLDASMANVRIAGDVFSAATDGVGIALGNTARIGGNAFANADVNLGDASVGGSVLSTQGKITFQNGSHIDGSAYARLGLLYTAGGNGRVAGDVVASAGSIGSSATSNNVNERYWSVGGSATASPAGCITNTVAVSGTVSPAQKPPGQGCWLPGSPLSPTVAFPATPNNPSGVSSPALPATVPAPPSRSLPALYSRTDPVTGEDALEAWRTAGWDVHVFSGSGSTPCRNALNYLTAAESGAYRAAWVAQPLAIVIQGCTDSFVWDQNNRVLTNGGNTFTLYNDLAIIADHGLSNQNEVAFRSDSTTKRSLMWIVPTDSPFAVGGYPQCSSGAGLSLSNVSATGVNWFFYTPCQLYSQNAFGRSTAPLAGAVYAGSVRISAAAYLQFVPMKIPGLGGGSPAGTRSVTLTYKREVIG
jgi:hypothetical protein